MINCVERNPYVSFKRIPWCYWYVRSHQRRISNDQNIDQWFSPRGDFAPWEHLAVPRDIVVVTHGGGDTANIWWVEAERLLNTLPRTPPQQRIVQPITVLSLEKPWPIPKCFVQVKPFTKYKEVLVHSSYERKRLHCSLSLKLVYYISAKWFVK